MAKYRKKPVVIEAEQWFEGPTMAAVHLIAHTMPSSEAEYWPHVHTIHSSQAIGVRPGDWIIPELDGIHFYPCKPDIFEATYELVDE